MFVISCNIAQMPDFHFCGLQRRERRLFFSCPTRESAAAPSGANGCSRPSFSAVLEAAPKENEDNTLYLPFGTPRFSATPADGGRGSGSLRLARHRAPVAPGRAYRHSAPQRPPAVLLHGKPQQPRSTARVPACPRMSPVVPSLLPLLHPPPPTGPEAVPPLPRLLPPP